MIYRAVLICVAGALAASLLGGRPEMKLGVTIAAGLCAAMLCLDGLRDGARTLQALSRQAGLEDGCAAAMLKATGVAMLAEFGAQLCRDAGESALAGRVEMAGRVTLMGIALPLLSGLTGRLCALLP